jgi:hypothetical protein
VTGYANPTKELLQEAQRVFDEDAEVASVVSLGAGKGQVLSVSGTGGEGGLMDAMAKMGLDSEQTHKEVDGRLHQSSVYFRLNVEHGLTGHTNASTVHAHTLAYMQEGDTDRLLNDVVKCITIRQKGSTLKDISKSLYRLLSPFLPKHRFGRRARICDETKTVVGPKLCRA